MSRRRCCCGGSTPYGTWKVWVPGCSGGGWPTTYQETPAGGVPGMVCELFAESGRTTLVASGTTDSVGRVNISVPSAAFYYARFTHPSGRFAVLNPGAAVNFTSATTVSAAYLPAAASGYTCSSLCRIPVATTLHGTTTFGAVTLTWNGSVWAGSIAYAYGGGGGCPAGTIAIDIWFRSIGATFLGNRASTSATCPGSGPADWEGMNPAIATLSCPTAAFLAEGSVYISNFFDVGVPLGSFSNRQTLANLYGATSGTFAYSVTE